MKLYSRKYHRYVERQIHFGVGKTVRTACGLVLYSRAIMVSLHSVWDGRIITDNLDRVTCQRCLATRDVRLHKLIEIDRLIPGIFDRETLCGEKWLLDHALDIDQESFEAQQLKINTGEKVFSLSNKIKSKDRKQIIRAAIKGL